MVRLVYYSLYLFSLLPFWVLYRISDLGYIILKLTNYRRKVIAENLLLAFPEKSVSERKQIAHDFYRNFADTAVESVKLLSISKKRFDKRVSVDLTEVMPLVKRGINFQFHSGHQMNWEYASLALSKDLPIPWLAVYKSIVSTPIDELFKKMRGRFGAILVERDRFKSAMPALIRNQYALGLIADQNPAIAENGYWLYFFGRPASFNIGPEKGAMRNRTAVVFVRIYRVKRGYYSLKCELVTEDGSATRSGELTRSYRDLLEESIRRQPSTYLWSHRRWKYNWSPGFQRRWVDNTPPPNSDLPSPI